MRTVIIFYGKTQNMLTQLQIIQRLIIHGMSSMKVTYAVQGTLLYRLHERLEKFCEVVANKLKPPISF